MSRYLLPIALLFIIGLQGQNAWAHHPAHPHFGNANPRAAAALGFGQVGSAGFGYGAAPYGWGITPGWYPGYLSMRYPGVGYSSQVVPGLPPNIYTQSYFNSPAYGHWNGFGN
jgi:hypothetical protein